MTMYKENLKSNLNPLLITVIWLVATYAFVILWGIAGILFEFSLESAKIIICIFETVWFGWFLMTKVLPEYNLEINSGKITISKTLSRRTNDILIIALKNVIGVYTSKDKLRQHRISKNINLTLSGQKSNPTYIVFNMNDTKWCVKIKSQKNLAKLLSKEKYKERN